MQAGDDALVADFVARRPEGLEGAYRRYASELLSVARHVVGDGAAAEDCVHDALLRVWRTPYSFVTQRGSLRAFLIACVRNEAMSALRRSARRSSREARADAGLHVVAEFQEPVDFVEAQRLHAALAALPAEQQLVIDRAYFKNLTHRQIASELAVPLGTVKTRIALAMKRLQGKLGPRDG